MGFFTRRDKMKAPQPQPVQPAEAAPTLRKMPPPSLFGPPNVFVYCDPPPKEPKAKKSSKSSKSSRADLDRRDRRDRYAKKDQKQDQKQLQLYHHNNASMPHLQHYQTPIIVNQHYYLGAPPPHAHTFGPDTYSNPRHHDDLHTHSPYSGALGNLTGSMAHLVKGVGSVPSCDDGLMAWYDYGNQVASSTSALYEDISTSFNRVMTLIDGERLSGDEMDLFAIQKPPPLPPNKPADPDGLALVPTKTSSDEDRDKSSKKKASSSKSKAKSKEPSKGKKEPKPVLPATSVAVSVVRGEYFSKVELYANSKLPDTLTPFAVYVPTWPLLCLAAQYSQSVYERPKGSESETHVSADWRTGAKAMCIKSLPMDHMSTIVFAIRGTSSFMDWAVNLKTAPVSPKGILDDEGNLCHAGFLDVARRMVKPVAARLRQLLHEDPGRSRYSLLITGHSAGGAVASLIYSHMLSQGSSTQSELRELTNRFKRVHCVTFGSPPISLLPLQKPDRPELRNSLFLSFVNEGDPVVRADKAYVKSLLELLASPPPEIRPAASSSTQSKESKDSKSKGRRSPSPHKPKSRHELKSKPSKSSTEAAAALPAPPAKPVWPVPAGTLSNAGRIVVLRSGKDTTRVDGRPKDRRTVRDRLAEGVTASFCTEDQLRGIIWGDPVSHLMSLYAGRVEALAVHYVTGKGH